MLEALQKDSMQRPQVIFKHNTRCMVSSMALNRIDKKEIESLDAGFYFLNIIRHRDLSKKIQDTYQVHHESPQILVIKEGQCIFSDSHNGIRLEEIVSLLQTQHN